MTPKSKIDQRSHHRRLATALILAAMNYAPNEEAQAKLDVPEEAWELLIYVGGWADFAARMNGNNTMAYFHLLLDIQELEVGVEREADLNGSDYALPA